MRIAIIDYVLDPALPGVSGLSDISWEMGRALARRGDDVHIIGPYSVAPEPYPGITVHRFKEPPIGYRNVVGYILIVLRAWRVMARIKGLDVAYAPEYLSTGIISTFGNIPVVLTTPGNIFERIANGNPFDRSMTEVLKVAARLSAHNCLLINTICKELAWWWERTGTPVERIAVFPYGVSADVFHPIPDARVGLALAAKQQVILYVGRLSKEKHVDTLLQAAAHLAEGRLQIQVHVLGDGPERQHLERSAAELHIEDHIVFHGQVPRVDLPLWYSAADAVVVASSSEPGPRVMLEAMACGTPFVGTPIGGMVDLVEPGITGYLSPVGDAPALAERLRWILDHPEEARTVGASARDYVRENLTWDGVAGQLRHEIERRLAPGATS